MIGVLCLHGFTGSPKEVEPLAQFFQQHTDWMIKTPTLPGHGHQLQLRGIRFHEWIKHAEMELMELLQNCERVFICGFSMGGLIASWLAAKYSVDKLILLSAAAYYTNPKKFLKEMMDMVKSGLQGNLHSNDQFQKYKYKFQATPFSAYLQFRKLVQFVKPEISKINVPTFIVQGKKDPIVPEKSAHYLYRTICSSKKKLLFIEEATHMICYGQYQNILFSEILTFLQDTNPYENIALLTH